jgi:hypothetical protein
VKILLKDICRHDYGIPDRGECLFIIADNSAAVGQIAELREEMRVGYNVANKVLSRLLCPPLLRQYDRRARPDWSLPCREPLLRVCLRRYPRLSPKTAQQLQCRRDAQLSTRPDQAQKQWLSHCYRLAALRLA